MGTDPTIDRRRRLPAIGQLLDDPTLRDAIELYGRDLVRVQARRRVDSLRAALDLPNGADFDARLAELPRRIADDLAAGPTGPLRRVINATGIFLHTNLGRAPLPAEVIHEVTPLLGGACDLEVDLATGRRDERNRRAAALLQAATGAEAALVTNNNAAALVVALAALARDREVIVSRGELVEIGGSFRIPEILEAAGAHLVEVGTTNRTRAADYHRAIGDETALLLKVHPSNFKIRGFTADASAAELAEVARASGVPLLVDEGSGLLRRSALPQLRDHESLEQLVDVGCDLVCGSGDKLLGGPQAGLLVGRAALVERCRRHPLYRAVRPDRFTFATLEAVLRRHLAGGSMPLARMTPDPDAHAARLAALAEALGAEVIGAEGYLGGGAAPDESLPGRALALDCGSGGDPGDGLDGGRELLETLRRGEVTDPEAPPPVVGYLHDGRLILDLRTVAPDDDHDLVRAVERARARCRRSAPVARS
ncbi:MAG: L-seryl-tRNA(Sec) selenium transferase [Acidobacteriota bacterium]